MKKILLLLYYILFMKLPSSYFPLGYFFNFFRIILLKNIFSLGNNNKIQKNVYIGSGKNISIGNNCQINENVKLDNVKLGNNVMIAPGVTILGKMHKYDDLNIPMISQGECEVKQSIVGNNVWIGTNAIIMPGVKIANGVIIGAGAVVTKDCKKNGIYGGVPSKLIKKRA